MSDKDFNLGNDSSPDSFFSGLLSRFEKMFNNKSSAFFDSDELEQIIEYYIENEEFQLAGFAIKTALDLFPDSYVFLFLKANYLYLKDNYEEALDLLYKLEKTYPNSVDVYILLGEILANGENTSESIKYFDKALALAEHDDIPEIINLITESLFELDKDTEILAYYKKYIKTISHNISLMENLVDVYIELGRRWEGIDYFNSLIDNNYLDYFAWFCLGKLYFSVEFFKKAIESYNYALAINPQYKEAALAKAQALIKEKQYDDAIDVYNELVKTEEDPHDLYKNLALIYEIKKDYHAAIEYRQKLLDAEPYSAYLRLYLISLYQKIKRYDITLKHFDFLTDNIDLIRYKYLDFIFEAKAITLENIELFSEAVISYKKAIELNPKSISAILRFSNLLIKEYDDFEAGKAILENGLKERPNNVKLLFRMAAIHFEIGLEQDGTQWLHTALSVDSTMAHLLFKYNPKLTEINVIVNLISLYNT